jgi:hypothetical protein
MTKSNSHYGCSKYTKYTVFPYAQCQGVECGYILHAGTLLATVCGVVSGGIKNEAIELGKNILQILAHMGIYSPQRKYMYPKEAVVLCLTSLADGNVVAYTSCSRNMNTLWQDGSALTGLLRSRRHLPTQHTYYCPFQTAGHIYVLDKGPNYCKNEQFEFGEWDVLEMV